MCIKIISPEKSLEFNPMEPLEDQVYNAKEILVKYEPNEERKMNSFVREMERMVLSGLSCGAEIKVETNNHLEGVKLERKLDKLKLKLNVNEMVKGLTKFHADLDNKLCELSKLCLEKNE